MKQPDKAHIKEWLNKAEGDYETALTLSKKNRKLFFIIAFHCQQAIEKYLKALLICHNIGFPQLHDLAKLLALLESKDPFLLSLTNDFDDLTPYAVGFRYPGDEIDINELKEVIAITKRLRPILIKRIKAFLLI